MKGERKEGDRVYLGAAPKAACSWLRIPVLINPKNSDKYVSRPRANSLMWRPIGVLLWSISSEDPEVKLIFTPFFFLFFLPPVSFLRLMMVLDLFFLMSPPSQSPVESDLANSCRCVSESSVGAAKRKKDKKVVKISIKTRRILFLFCLILIFGSYLTET